VRGVFLERLFEFSITDGRLSSGSSFGALPVRSLVMRGLPREVQGDLPIRCDSFGL
jgi:hypothetical protein